MILESVKEKQNSRNEVKQERNKVKNFLSDLENGIKNKTEKRESLWWGKKMMKISIRKE